MAGDQHQEILDRYIARVVALRNERGRALELNDMKEVARELGMGEDDIAAADQAAHAHLERGLRHLSHGRWDDAVTELRDALVLIPTSIDVLHGLAVAHKERWRERALESDRVQAVDYARRSLSLLPAHDPSYKLLNELDTPRVSRKSSKRKSNVGMVIALCAITIVAIKVWPVITGSGGGAVVIDDPGMVTPSVAPPAAAPEVGDGTGLGSHLSETGRVVSGTESAMPLIWECTKEEGVNIAIYDLGAAGAVRGIAIRNTGEKPIRSLRLQARSDAGVLTTVEQSYSPALAPGETRPTNVTLAEHAGASEHAGPLELSVVSIR